MKIRALILWVLAFQAANAVAQTTPSGERRGADVREVAPPIPLRVEKNGELIALPGFTLADLLEMVIRRARDPAEARYTIKRVEVRGADEGGLAELMVDFTIQVLDDQGPVRVPLDLGEVLLRFPAPSRYRMEDDRLVAAANPPAAARRRPRPPAESLPPEAPRPPIARVEYLAQEKRFECVLPRGKDVVHQLQLRCAAPIRETAGVRSLSLTLPPAPLKMQLTVPWTDVESEAIGNQLTSQQVLEEQTELVVEGLEGNLQLSWRRRETQSAARRFLTSRSTIEVRIDDQLSVSSKATLELQSAAGGLGVVDVQLPPNMRYKESVAKQPGISIEQLRPLSQAGEPEVVRIRWEDPQTAKSRVELNAALVRLVGQEALEVVGFRVLEATQQTGSITVLAAEGWSARPELVQGMRRESVTETPGYTSWKYVFAGPASSLRVAVSQTTQSVHIDPLYIVQAQGEQLKLEARLTCRLQGPPDARIVLELPLPEGWVVRRVSPESAEPPDLTATPLPLGVARGGESGAATVIRVFATRPVTDLGLLSLNLPKPTASGNGLTIKVSNSPPRIILAPADNLRLTPRTQDTAWLVEEGLPLTASELGLPPLQQAPRLFSAASVDAGALEADVERHAGAVTADIASDIELSDKLASVEQTLTYSIAFERIDSLLLDVDSQLVKSAASLPAGANRLGIYLKRSAGDPVLLMFQVVDHPDLPPGRSVIRVALPELLIGAQQLLIRSFAPLSLAPAERSVVRLPLARPVPSPALRLGQHALTVRSTRPQRVRVVGDDWTARPGTDDPLDRYILTGEEGRSVSVQWGERVEQPQSSVVEKIWIQTWLSPEREGQRAVFRVQSAQAQLEFQLPANDQWMAPEIARPSGAAPGRESDAGRGAGSNGDEANPDRALADGADAETGAAGGAAVGAESGAVVGAESGDTSGVWELDVAVNGIRVEPQLDRQLRRVTVPLPGSGGVHVVEVWRLRERPAAASGRQVLRFPQLLNARGAPRTFWQVVLPESRYLVGEPQEMTADMAWSWSGGRPQRTATMRQLELETWIGATLQDPPPLNSRVYLYSSFGPPTRLEIWSLSRRLLVLLVAGGLLAGGLLLLTFHSLRHPGVLLPLGAAIGGAAAAWPNIALASAEAAAVGSLLIALAGAVRWVVDPATRQPRRRAPDDTQSLSVLPVPGVASPDGTTATAAGVMAPLPEPRP